jgi:hypothetical protein
MRRRRAGKGFTYKDSDGRTYEMVRYLTAFESSPFRLPPLCRRSAAGHRLTRDFAVVPQKRPEGKALNEQHQLKWRNRMGDRF